MKIRKKRRNKQTLALTNNNKEYKSVKKRLEKLCSFCAPNRGCNRNRDNDYKCWKRYRTTQWRE